MASRSLRIQFKITGSVQFSKYLLARGLVRGGLEGAVTREFSQFVKSLMNSLNIPGLVKNFYFFIPLEEENR